MDVTSSNWCNSPVHPQMEVEVEGFVEAIGIPDLFFGAVEFPMASVDDAVMVGTEDGDDMQEAALDGKTFAKYTFVYVFRVYQLHRRILMEKPANNVIP